MISYDVDEQNKIITCTIQGEELKNCAIKHIQKLLHSTPNNIFQINTDKLYLSSQYTGTAKYAPDESTPFDIDIGKTIARKKAFQKFNSDMKKKCNLLIKQAQFIYETSLYKSFEYDNNIKDISRKLKKY